MRAAIRIILLLTAAAEVASAQGPAQRKPDADRLGMTCAQILKMTSMEWIAYFGQKTELQQADTPNGILRANAAYGKCYDARTDALAASLTKSGKAPSKAARADFAGFEAALKNFTAKAVADTQPPADAQKRSYATLYEKHFRRGFYERYEPGGTSAAGTVTQSNPSPNSSSASSKPAANDTDAMSKAKNRFGELLGVLPDDKLHELHAAFGAILGQHEVDHATRLAVYRYAIFLLEPGSAENSYPPPF